jgi:hypothetical protein
MFIFIKFGIRLTLSFFGALALLHVEFFEEKIDNLRNFSGKDIADNHRIPLVIKKYKIETCIVSSGYRNPVPPKHS